MASSPPPSQPPQPPSYWCHNCLKHVSVEPSPDDQTDLICSDCQSGFVEAESPPIPIDQTTLIENDETTLASQFLNVLRLLSEVSHDNHRSLPPSPPSPPHAAFDIPIEGDGDHQEEENDDEDDDDDDVDEDEEEDEDEESVRSVEIEGEVEAEGENSDDDVEETEDEIRRRIRRETIRRQLREFATRPRTGRRNRILDWAEILIGLENNSIQLRFEVPETDRYVGNPGDYVNDAEYEALLQNLADEGGKRGAPPASKAAVDNLKAVEVKEEKECFVCAICKDGVVVGETVKEMPCGHGYHGDCIVTWLGERNSCPVCRFELVTDDVEYEEDKKKKNNFSLDGSSSSFESSS